MSHDHPVEARDIHVELQRLRPSPSQIEQIYHGLEHGHLHPFDLLTATPANLDLLLADSGAAAALADTQPDLTTCPDWCTLPAGHPWTGQTGNEWTREHERRLAATSTGSGPAARHAVIYLMSNETDLDSRRTISSPRIVLAVDDSPELTAGQARRLAAKLHDAADLYDRIGGQQ